MVWAFCIPTEDDRRSRCPALSTMGCGKDGARGFCVITVRGLWARAWARASVRGGTQAWELEPGELLAPDATPVPDDMRAQAPGAIQALDEIPERDATRQRDATPEPGAIPSRLGAPARGATPEPGAW
jgi:hypothetical protein